LFVQAFVPATVPVIPCIAFQPHQPAVADGDEPGMQVIDRRQGNIE